MTEKLDDAEGIEEWTFF